MHSRDVRFLASVDFCDFQNCLPIAILIHDSMLQLLLPGFAIPRNLKFLSKVSQVYADQLWQLRNSAMLHQPPAVGRDVWNNQKNMNLPLSDNHNVGWLPKTTSPREKKSLKQTRERECQCEWVGSPLLGWPLTCPDDQLSILSSTQLEVRRKVESANRTQLPIGRIAPLVRDSPPFSLSSHRRWAIQAIAGLAADITKLLAAAAAASNHGCSQTADYKRPRGLTAEITARASSQLFRWTSCAAGGGLGATEGARAAGAATLAGSQSWRQPGHWRADVQLRGRKSFRFDLDDWHCTKEK